MIIEKYSFVLNKISGGLQLLSFPINTIVCQYIFTEEIRINLEIRKKKNCIIFGKH